MYTTEMDPDTVPALYFVYSVLQALIPYFQ
jgi:hypothetical protein